MFELNMNNIFTLNKSVKSKRSKYGGSIDEEEKQKAQWDLECSSFYIKGGRLFSFSSSNGQNIGEVQQYPSLDKFQETAFDYIKGRARATTS